VTPIEERMVGAGLLPAEARRKREIFEQVDETLRTLGGGESDGVRRFFVPGRIEVLGKHTDYAGGRSLLCAAGRGFCIAARPRTDAVLRIVDRGRGLSAEVPLDAALEPEGSGWIVFARTVAARAALNFPGVRGADVVLASDLPRAAGLSSSSALVAALFAVLADRNELAHRPEWSRNIRNSEELGGYLGSVESGGRFGTLAANSGVGTRGGCEDATAIVGSRAGQISQFAFGPPRRERSMPLDPDWSFVVASSGVAADKTGGARESFNRLSRAAAEILAIWNRSTGRSDSTLFAALAGRHDVPDRIRGLLRTFPGPEFSAEFLIARFDQFVEESFTLVPRAGDLLEKGEVILLGEVVDRSQELAEECLANQVPETAVLAHSARELGAAAASAFGGGFGGSVWALSRTADAEAFRRRWAEVYVGRFPAAAAESRFFVTRPGPPVLVL
jgi:galactokinase